MYYKIYPGLHMHTDLEFKWPGHRWFRTCYKSWSTLGTYILCGKNLWSLINYMVFGLSCWYRSNFSSPLKRPGNCSLWKYEQTLPLPTPLLGIWRQKPQGVGYQNHLENCQSTDWGAGGTLRVSGSRWIICISRIPGDLWRRSQSLSNHWNREYSIGHLKGNT